MLTILEQLQKALKDIHYPLCRLEKYVFDYKMMKLMNKLGIFIKDI